MSLRVSVATLVRVLFKNPKNDEFMPALKRKATLRETDNGRVVEVKSQPFGGAIRILELNTSSPVIPPSSMAEANKCPNTSGLQNSR